MTTIWCPCSINVSTIVFKSESKRASGSFVICGNRALICPNCCDLADPVFVISVLHGRYNVITVVKMASSPLNEYHVHLPSFLSSPPLLTILPVSVGITTLAVPPTWRSSRYSLSYNEEQLVEQLFHHFFVVCFNCCCQYYTVSTRDYQLLIDNTHN